MSAAPDRPYFEAALVPALLRIQHEHGYLERAALEEYARQSGLSLARMHAVASFFPHFRLAPPPKVTLRVCRDMSCHLAGSGKLLRELQFAAGGQVAVEGVSCLSRCDRAPAACVAVAGSEHDHYFLGRSREELEALVAACLRDELPAEDRDTDAIDAETGARFSCLALPAAGGSVINPYGESPDYAAVRNAVMVRDAALLEATKKLEEKYLWGRARREQFRVAATRQLRTEIGLEEGVEEFVREWLTDDGWAKGETLGGWSDSILRELDDANLRGMGGAGAIAADRWRDVRRAVRKARSRGENASAFIVANGDESEPGTFKDRELLLHTPHLVLEGVILAGLLTEATQGFIFIRHEYAEQIDACRAEILRAEQLGYCGLTASALGRPFPVSVFVSPGGYICGEQSALIEAMSDRRGEPRNMPPKLETNGLENLPTLVSNIETFSWAPAICLNGGSTYAGQGQNGSRGRRIFSISGDVRRPGVYEVPIGMTLRELLNDYCGGVSGEGVLKAVAPSGPSGGFLPVKLTAERGLPRRHTTNKTWLALAKRRGFDPAATELDVLDLELDLDVFRALSPTAALGAGIVIYNAERNLAVEAINSIEFFRNESCGKCVPCRLGSQKLATLGGHLLAKKITRARWEKVLLPLIREMSPALTLASICGLGRSVPLPLQTVVDYFPDDLAAFLT